MKPGSDVPHFVFSRGVPRTPLPAVAVKRPVGRRGWVATASALVLALLTPLPASAQAFPSKPVHIVVPFPPGGSTDVLARKLSEKLGVAWGQTVVVDNRGGAGGTVGADYVAKSTPDGTTLLMGVTGSNAIAGALYPKLPYDVIRSFAPVSLVVSAPLVLVSRPESPAKTVQAMVAAARAKPSSLTYGSPGNGTSMHLTGEMFDLEAHVAMLHVPYRGSAAALTDLLSGQIDTMFGDFLVVWPQIEAGKLLAVAVTSKQRHPMLPVVPTIAESGYPDFEALSWQGLFAPAGTPPAVIERIARDVAKALADADLQSYFSARGFSVGGGSSPAEFTAFVAAESAKWARIVKASGAKPD